MGVTSSVRPSIRPPVEGASKTMLIRLLKIDWPVGFAAADEDAAAADAQSEGEGEYLLSGH